MVTIAIPNLITAEEFAMMDEFDDVRRELVNGELVEVPLNPPIHGISQANAGMALGVFAFPRRLGAALIRTGFLISRNPDTVRMPDVAFVSADKLPGERPPDCFFSSAPDIAVEVITRSDSPSAARDRARIWLDAGSSLVWLMFTASRSVAVYRPNEDVATLGEDDFLDAAPVLDGFSARVSEFFDFYGLYG